MPTVSSPVDEIKERLDIAEVLAEYMKLLPSGPNRYKVLCPFHNEKTPSLMVSKDKQAWHCFGCGKGGDMFTFVQEIEGIEFPEALRILAKKANVELRSVDPKLQNAKTRLLDLLKLAAAFYRKVLTDASGVQAARDYLNSRGVFDDTAEDFHIGYSPTTWDGLLTFMSKKGFREQEVFDAGLAVKRERGTGYYDRFRGRLLFPIRDVNGAVVGFGGRIIEQVEGDASAAAKYINTPETLVYSKASVLYGLDRARQAIKQADLAILVEGYMDCIASHQAGVANVVAVSGTALTDRQVRQLKRYTNNVALAFDADLAGGEAARRGIDQAIAADMRVTIITLPDAKDPDELIKRDPAAWRNAISRAERIVDYSFSRAFASLDPTDVDGKKRIAQQLLPVISRLPDPVEQSHYLQLLGQRLSVDEGSLREAMKRAPSKQLRSVAAPSSEVAEASFPISRVVLVAERMLALSLYAKPEFFPDISEKVDPIMLKDPELQALYRQAILYYSQNQQIDQEGFRKHIAQELPLLGRRTAKMMMLAEHDLAELSEDEAHQDLEEGIQFLRRQAVSDELQRIEAELRQSERTLSAEHTDGLLKRMSELTEQLRSFDA